MWPLYKRRLQQSKLPVLCGPWKGELGFEALYWVPFLRRLGISSDRLIPITRGGAHLWYPADRHVELFDLRTPKAVRVDNLLTHQRTAMLKQQAWTDFDRHVIKDAAAKLGLKQYLTLHPHWMYAQLTPFWEGRMSLGDLERQVKIESLPMVEANGATLPEHFVAVRFYARTTFPHADATQTVAVETIKKLAAHQTVVLLHSSLCLDDHFDFEIPKIPNVVTMSDLFKVTPQNNLMVQSALLCKAQGFVGTYGGLAQLAMLYKKPTISFYTDWQGTAVAHRQLMEAIALQMGVCCQVVRLTEIPLLHAVLPHLSITMGQRSSAATPVPDPARS
jgi:hypothetical protein